MRQATAAEIAKRAIRLREKAQTSRSSSVAVGDRLVPWLVIGSATGFVLTGNAIIQLKTAAQSDAVLLETLTWSATMFLMATFSSAIGLVVLLSATEKDGLAADAEADLLEGVTVSDREDELTSETLRDAEASLGRHMAWGGGLLLTSFLILFLAMAFPLLALWTSNSHPLPANAPAVAGPTPKG